MNLMGKPPLGLKSSPSTKDPKHLEKIRSRRCIICTTFGEVQLSPTAAHHCIHDRFGTRKASDSEAIPLCEGHHQGLWDTSKLAIHKDKKAWRDKYGPDWSYLDGSSHAILA